MPQRQSSSSFCSIFERAAAYVGTDYLAHGLWDKYLAYEGEQGNKLHVASLYSRVLGLPVRDLDRYLAGLRAFVHSTPLLELMREEEAGSIRSQLEEEHRQAAEMAAAAAKEAAAKAAAEAAAAKAEGEGAEASAMAVDEAAKPAEAEQQAPAAEGEGGPAAVPAVSEEDIKAGWMRSREALHAAAAAELEGRRLYEEQVGFSIGVTTRWTTGLSSHVSTLA